MLNKAFTLACLTFASNAILLEATASDDKYKHCIKESVHDPFNLEAKRMGFSASNTAWPRVDETNFEEARKRAAS